MNWKTKYHDDTQRVTLRKRLPNQTERVLRYQFNSDMGGSLKPIDRQGNTYSSGTSMLPPAKRAQIIATCMERWT